MRKLKQSKQVVILRGDCPSIVKNPELSGDRGLGPLCPLCPLCPPAHSRAAATPGLLGHLAVPAMDRARMSAVRRAKVPSYAWALPDEEEMLRKRRDGKKGGGFGISQKWLLVCFALGREAMGVWVLALSSSRELQLALEDTSFSKDLNMQQNLQPLPVGLKGSEVMGCSTAPRDAPCSGHSCFCSWCFTRFISNRSSQSAAQCSLRKS